MKQLKFRAWDALYGKMMFSEKLSEFFHAVEQRPEEQGPPVMSWTGLKDKNGKEIYEGDIVEKMISGRKVKTSVLWDDSLTGFTGLKNILDCEIIGNIYESPSLLGKV